MDSSELILRVVGGIIIWGLIGLAIAWLIKVLGKRERLPKWPIYVCLGYYVVSTVIGALVLSAALESEFQNLK
jgi:FtsH-binding integral membrane protein